MEPTTKQTKKWTKKKKRKYSDQNEIPSKSYQFNHSPKLEQSRTISEDNMSTADDELKTKILA